MISLSPDKLKRYKDFAVLIIKHFNKDVLDSLNKEELLK